MSKNSSTNQNGKGSSPRNNHSKDFRDNYSKNKMEQNKEKT